MELHIETEGQGRDVVLLHGMPQSPEDLRPLLHSLKESFRTHLVHLPGYGRSPLPETTDLAAETSALASRLATDLGVERCGVVGSSAGFYRGALLALRPGKPVVHTLVGLGSLAGLRDHERPLYHGAADALDAGEDIAPMMPERMLSAAYRARHARAAEHARSMASATHPEHLARELRAFGDAPDLLPALAEHTCRVYMRTGELDMAASPEEARRVAEATGGKAAIVPGAGHLLLLEDFEGTVAAVQRAMASA